MPNKHAQKFTLVFALTFFAFTALVIYQSSVAHAEPLDAGPTRIGIILLQADHAPSQLAEASAVELLPDLDAQPVERTELDQVLEEQALSLSAMSDPASALILGRALRADALLILQPNGQYLYARVMDTLHGVILAEALLDIKQPESFSKALHPILTRALQKIRIPADEMVYVSVMGVTASADVQALKTAASQLGPLIRADLQAIPHVRVVERDQLAQIKRENQLAGGEADIYGSAIVIEGELRPVDNASKTELAILITDQNTQTTTSIKAKPTTPNIADLRTSARSLIAKHLAIVEAQAPTMAGPAEAAAILARAQWRVRHNDFEGVMGLVEAALLIDDSPDRLKEAWWAFYYLDRKLFRTDPQAGILSVRRGHEVLLQRLRHPTQAKDRTHINITPMLMDHASDIARSERDKDNLLRIRQTSNDLYDLYMAHHLAEGLSVTGLKVRRLRALPYLVTSAEEYVEQAITLIEQIQLASAKSPPGRQDMLQFVVDDLFRYLDFFKDKSPNMPLRLRSEDVHPVFEWMRTQDELNLNIFAQWYEFRFAPPQKRASEAFALMAILCEDPRLRESPWYGKNLAADRPNNGVTNDTLRWLSNNDQFGEWFDGLLDRVEASGSLVPLLRWNAGFFPGYIVHGDRDRVGMARLNRMIDLLDRLQADAQSENQRNALRRSALDLKKKLVDKPSQKNKTKRKGPWDAYDVSLIDILGRTDDMARPAAYYVQGERGAGDRQLYIAWFSNSSLDWIFTRCPITGGPLQVVGKGHVRHADTPRDHYFQMVACQGYVIAGGWGGLITISEQDGTVKRYGPEQGLPDIVIRSLGVVNDRVIVGSKNGVSMLDPATGQVQIICNALAAEARSPLDRVAPYHVVNIMTTADHNGFWFEVAGNDAGNMRGLWQHDFDTGATRKIVTEASRIEAWVFRDQIMVSDSYNEHLSRVDPDTATLHDHEFTGFFKNWRGQDPVAIGGQLFALVNDHEVIVGANRRRYKKWKVNWDVRRYAVELNDHSIFLGYTTNWNDDRQPAMWIITRKVVKP